MMRRRSPQSTSPPSPSKILRASLGGFLIGVFLASFWFTADGWLTIVSGCVAFGCFLFATTIAMWLHPALFSFERRLFFLSAVALIFGSARYCFVLPFQDSIAFASSKEVRVEGTIVSAKQQESSQRIVLGDLEVDGIVHDDRMQATTALFPRWSYGDRVFIRCDLEKPEAFDGFSYDRYLASKDVYALCRSYDPPILIASGNGSTVRGTLQKVRREIIRRIDQTFGEPHASLLAGLLLGEQRFTKAWQARFVATGTTHIVAASGYNVSMVLVLSLTLFTRFGISRARAFAWLMTCVILYVFLAGAEAPVVRAGIMGILVLFSRQLGRHTTMTNILLATAAGMLMLNPRLLRDDIGFQLSMLSTIGLIYLAPWLERKLTWIPKRYAVRESLTATLAATVMTLPIILFGFRRISFVSPIANVLILPFIPLAMALGAVTTLVSLLNVQVATVVSLPAWALLHLMLILTEILSAVPYISVVI